jgi:hypothetical protein
MGHPDDIRCVPGEEVTAYPGFYRPLGGYIAVHPKGTRLPTEAEMRDGSKAPPTTDTRKTFSYTMAEMSGR